MKKYGTLLNSFGGWGNRSLGFTLAEVLVTLGIIGVVSAMTLPTLVKNHQRTVYVTQLQKVVNELSQAVEKATQENNAISLDETKYSPNAENGARDFLNDNFKIANNCGTDLTPCFADSYKRLDGTAFTLQNPSTVVSLASGASVSSFNGWYDDAPICTDANGHSYDCRLHGYYQLQVDINGAQGPNIVGRDLFYMELYSDGKVAEQYTDKLDVNPGWHADYCGESDATYGMGCLSKIMQDGWKMDY